MNMTKVLRKDDNNYIEFKTRLSKGHKVDYEKATAMKLQFIKGELVPILDKTLEQEGDTLLLTRMLVKVVDSGKEIKLDGSISGICKFLREECFGTETLIDDVLAEIKAINFPSNEVKPKQGKPLRESNVSQE